MIDHDRMAAALPGYDLGEELGRGSFGIVFSAYHRRLNREVAVKQLPRAFGADPDVRARFVAEAQILADLEHPHIVGIFDYVEHDGLCLLVMEKLTGRSLAERHREAPFNDRQSCAIAVAAATALDCAHSQGILHRDVKPENLMFSRRGTLRVTDFGIAKMLTGSAGNRTQTGVVLGTPAFMAPEQAQGGELSPATDVYALATVVYELLAKSLPFPEEADPLAALFQRVHNDPRPLQEANPTVPASVAEVIDRALARTPGERFATAEDFAVAVVCAGSQAWGPGWLDSTGVELLAAGRVLSRANNGNRVVDRSDSTATTAPVDTPPSRRAETVASAPVTRRSRRRLPMAVVSILVVALVAVAAGLLLARGGDDPDSAAPPARPGPATTRPSEIASARALPAEPGPIDAGSYITTGLSSPLTFTLGDGWEKTQESTPQNVVLSRTGRPDQSVHITWADQLVDPRREPTSFEDLPDGLLPGRPPAQLVDWLRAHPRLTVGDVAPIPGAAVNGVVVNFEVKTSHAFEPCPRACVVLFAHPGVAIAAFRGDQNRLALYGEGTRTLAVLINGGQAPDERFESELAVLLKSVSPAPVA